MKKFLCIIFFVCILFVLSGCNNNNENVEIEKGLSEVRFLENQCITIFNKCFSNEYLLEDNSIDWSLVNEDFNVVRNSMDVVLIDFASLQVPSQSIVDLDNSFKELESFIQNQELDKFVRKICDTYNLVSNTILDNISNDEKNKLEKKSKSSLLYVGYYLISGNKEFALSNLDVFEENYSKLSSDRNYIESNSYKINRTFIHIKNIRAEINNEEFDKAKDTLSKILEFF